MQSRVLILIALVGAVRSYAEDAPKPAEQPPAPAVADAKTPEDVVRKRFVLAYQSAATTDARVEVVKMLKGLTEKATRRLLAGMLADRDEAVRIAACKTMASTPDEDGYFVKPLMGALTDPSDFVRMAAADALGSARIRADAVKALSIALMTVAGTISNLDEGKNKNTALVVQSYNGALERLTAQRCKENDARSQSAFWTDYWKQREDDLRAKDLELRGGEPEPVRPDGLEPDSFDKKDKPTK